MHSGQVVYGCDFEHRDILSGRGKGRRFQRPPARSNQRACAAMVVSTTSSRLTVEDWVRLFANKSRPASHAEFVLSLALYALIPIPFIQPANQTGDGSVVLVSGPCTELRAVMPTPKRGHSRVCRVFNRRQLIRPRRLSFDQLRHADPHFGLRCLLNRPRTSRRLRAAFGSIKPRTRNASPITNGAAKGANDQSSAPVRVVHVDIGYLAALVFGVRPCVNHHATLCHCRISICPE